MRKEHQLKTLALAAIGFGGVILGAYLLSPLSSRKLSDEQFVQRYAASPEPVVQDKVGQAKIRLAYKTAKTGDMKAARAAFLETAKTYKGTGAISADFGGVPDGAAYQAAATYSAEGRVSESRAAFKQFIKDYPLSPLVHGAHKRLVKLNPERSDDYDRMLQECIDRQQEKAKREQVTCGPKCIVKLLQIEKKPAKSYEEIAKLCGTDDSGTSMLKMVAALRQLGFTAKGYRLNAADATKVMPPAILLKGSHYVVVTERIGTTLTYFDPTLNTETWEQLPQAEDTTFDIISLHELNLVNKS